MKQSDISDKAKNVLGFLVAKGLLRGDFSDEATTKLDRWYLDTKE